MLFRLHLPFETVPNMIYKDNLRIEYLTNSIFSSRTYWFAEKDRNRFWLVDCGDLDLVIRHLPENAKIIGVLLTHVHFDHIYGLNQLIGKFPGCKVYTNNFGQKSLTDPKRNFSRYHTDVEDFVFSYPENVVVVGEGEKIELFEGIYADVYHTPGHDESCLCYEIGEDIFTGDAYIPGVGANTQLPHANKEQAQQSMERILKLAEWKIILPGHQV